MAALAAVVVLAAAACTDRGTTDGAGPSATTTTTALTKPTVTTIARVDAFNGSFADIFGDRLTWTTGPSRQVHDRVMVHDLRTAKTSVAVAAAKKGTALEFSRGSRDTLVFTEQDYGPNPDTDADVPWRVFALDLVTGKRQLLDQGVTTAQFAPTIVIGWPWVAWVRSTAAHDRHDIVVQDLRDGSRTTVVQQQDVTSTEIVGNAVVYAASSAAGQDLYAIDLPAGEPRRLTTSGQISRAGKVGGSLIAYEEPTNGDPQRLAVVPVSGGPSVELRNTQTAGNIVAGDGFAAWYSKLGRGVEVSRIGRHAPSTTAFAKPPSISIRLSADGKRVAWGEMTGAEGDIDTMVIVVAEVT
jgi:hypothetical protein